MKDFSDEIPGYLYNERICEALKGLPIRRGISELTHNLELCYGVLVGLNAVDREEIRLLKAWIGDIE